jgi:hypothetical protein
MPMRLLIATMVLSTALLVGFAPSLQAQRQPLLIATVRSLDELFGDLNYLAEAAGAAPLGQILTITTEQYARGLDRSRPIVLYVDTTTRGDRDFRWLVFLPTLDLPTFLQAASAQLGSPRRLDSGVIQTSGARTLFLQPHGSWTLLAGSPAELRPPDMPIEQIVLATDGKADLSIRVFVANMPSDLRNKIGQQLRTRAETELAQIGSEDPTSELLRFLTRQKWDQVAQVIRDADEIGVAWTTDSHRRKVAMRINLTARPDTLTHRRLSQLELRKSAFSGMLDSSTFATWNAIGKLPDEDTVRFEQLLRSIQIAATTELRASKRFTDEGTRQLTVRLTQSLLETFRESLRAGFFDGAGMIFFTGNQLSAVVGMHVADTSALHDAAVALAGRQSAAGISWQAQLNVASYQNVAVHVFSFATPNDPAWQRAVGDKIDITLGIGPQEIYLAWGKRGVPRVQRTIDAVRRGSAERVLPFHGRVSLTPLLRFYAKVSRDAAAMGLLQSAASRPEVGDSAMVRVTPIRDGVRLEMEADENVLRAIGYYALLSKRKGT